MIPVKDDNNDDDNSYRLSVNENEVSMDALNRKSESSIKESMIAYLILFILGLGNLLPWNAFIIAEPYYIVRFCGTPFVSSFEVFYGLSYNLSQCFGLMVSLFYSEIIPLKVQVRIPLLLYGAIFLITTITVAIPMSGYLLFWITLICTFLCGFTGSIMLGGLFGITGLLPSAYTSALMLGASGSALLISLLSFVIVLPNLNSSCTSDDDLNNDDSGCEGYYTDYGSIGYFSFSTLTLFTCIFLFEIFLKLPFLK